MRRRRYDQRAALWQLSHLARVRRCGYAPAGGGPGGVEVRQATAGGVAHYGNLQTCGSIHACPVCAPKIRAKRAEDIERLLTAHLAGGGGVEFWTETMPHDRADDLAPMLDAVNKAHRAVLSGRAWAGAVTYAHGCTSSTGRCSSDRMPVGCSSRVVVDVALGIRDQLGVDGTVTAMEVTYGANGWHAHLHTVVLTARPWDDAQRARFLDYAEGRWSSAIVRANYRRPGYDRKGRRVNGVAVTVVPVNKRDAVAMADYLAKNVESSERDRAAVAAGRARTPEGWAVSAEVARGDLKGGRDGGLSPMELLASAVEDGDVDALSRWWEYEEATKGRQAIRWSKGLRDRYDLGDEATDEELAAETVGGDVVMVLATPVWERLRHVKGGPARLLVEVEAGGAERADRWLGNLADRGWR